MLGAAALLFALNVAVFASRADSVFRRYRLTATEGAEGPNPYAIWRLLHGYTLYESPSLPRFPFTLYNFGFYRLYAAVLGIAGVDGDQILLGARLISVALGLIGCFCYWQLALELVGPLRARRSIQVFTGALAFVVWLGTNFAGWWPLAIRPDVGAWLFVTLGLWSFVRWIRLPNQWSLIAASLLFFCAWTFKQSAILTFAGVLGWALLVIRRPAVLVALAAPFGLLAATAIALGGESYRFSILRTSTLSPWELSMMINTFCRGFLQNSFIWVFPVYVVVRSLKSPKISAEGSESAPLHSWERLAPNTSLLAFSGALAMVAGTFALGRVVSNKNHLMEAYLLLGLLASKGAAELVLDAPSSFKAPRAGAFALVLLLPMLAFPAVQLLFPNRFGITRLLSSEAEQFKRSATAELVRGLPKPLFIEDDVLSLPWNSNDNRYPAVVIDRSAYRLAKLHGIVSGGGVEGLIQNGFFASVVLPVQDPRISKYASEKYSCAAAPQVRDLVACIRR